jgi:phage gpG-like protein
MIKIDVKIPDLSRVFKTHQHDIMMALAASMQTNRGMMFDKDGADNGKEKWAPLVLRKGRPLQKTGTLRKSFAPQITVNGKPAQGKDTVLRFEGTKVVIGTKLLYAGMMNDGTTKMKDGVLRPVMAQALKIPLESGKFMFRRSVKIPARRMDEITSEDKAEFNETVANYIADLLNRNVGS